MERKLTGALTCFLLGSCSALYAQNTLPGVLVEPGDSSSPFGGPTRTVVTAQGTSVIISGRVLENGFPLVGVNMVRIAGLGGDILTTTNGNGEYAIAVPNDLEFIYIVAPDRTGCTFEPYARVYHPPIVSASGQDFVATCAPVPVTISGQVRDLFNVPLSGVSLTLSALNGSASYTAQTQNNGNFRFSVPGNLTYSLTPAWAGCTFEPMSRVFHAMNTSQYQDFVARCTATALTIGGTIRDNSGNPQAGVSVILSGGLAAAVQTSSSGDYQFSIAAGLDVIVTPTRAGCTFVPERRSFHALNASQPGQNFVATCASITTWTIGGTIRDHGGTPMSGISMKLSGGATNLVQTLSGGSYQFSVAGGLSYVLTPTRSGCSFIPANRSISNLSESQTGLDFVASCPVMDAGLSFVPVAPCRVVDTRVGEGKTGAFGPPGLTGGTTRPIPILQGGCNIPSSAQAYSLNFTVVPRVALSYLTTWPAGQTQPLVSTLNSLHGGVISNAAIVSAGINGAINVFVTETADVVVDINGYFDAPASANALDYYPLAPCRIVDTRGGFGGMFGPPALLAAVARLLPILTAGCGVSANARAYSLNATVVPPGPLAYLTLFPAGAAQPLVSTLNSFEGLTASNAAIVAGGNGGAVNAYVTDRTDLLLDLNGYFAPPSTGSLKFYPAAPCRVADTRAGQGPIAAGGTTRQFQVAGVCGIPANAQAFSLNVTVAPSEPLAYLNLWPAGQSQPLTSTLSSPRARVLANAAIVKAGAGGAVSVFVTNTTHVILDVNGYFAPF
ncbi:MAG: carboxypeptidase regulatory-like domain-containing protein [Acidobacteria bacterium]|nr:carboxypeptidase regulatory-like domain-containing protein [Acidobacteriota bacterium]